MATPPSFNDILSRVSLGLSHNFAAVTSTINRESAAPSNTASPSTSANGQPQTQPQKGFSTLLSTASSAPSIPSQPRSKKGTKEDEDSDLAPSWHLPPNAGVGFAPNPSSSNGIATNLADRALRDRLGRVGFKGARGNGKDGKGRKRLAEESESEEEVGRSAVGRRRKGNVAALEDGNGSKGEKGKRRGGLVGDEGGGNASKRVKREEGNGKEVETEEKAGLGHVEEVESAVSAEGGQTMSLGTKTAPVLASGEVEPSTGESKTKKKKKKKKSKAQQEVCGS